MKRLILLLALGFVSASCIATTPARSHTPRVAHPNAIKWESHAGSYTVTWAGTVPYIYYYEPVYLRGRFVRYKKYTAAAYNYNTGRWVYYRHVPHRLVERTNTHWRSYSYRPQRRYKRHVYHHRSGNRYLKKPRRPNKKVVVHRHERVDKRKKKKNKKRRNKRNRR